jgi:hypothetical protein
VSRSNIVLIIVIAVVIGFFVYLSSLGGDLSDSAKWRYYYTYKGDKLPHDRDFFIDYLAEESKKFNTIVERFSRIYISDKKGLYFFYNEKFEIDKTETQAVYDYVARGNSALIIANDFNFEFFKEIRGIQTVSDDPYIVLQHADSALTLLDTVSLRRKHRTPVSLITYGENALRTSFVIDTANIDKDIYATATVFDWEDEETYDEDEYDYEEEAYSYEDEEYAYEEGPAEYTMPETEITKKEQSEFSKAIIEGIGKTKNQGTNLVKVKLGEGYIYLHSNPALFTNAQFDKPEVYNYINAIFDELEFDEVYWDELSFQFLNAENEGYGLSDKSYFEYIFRNRALKTAFYFFLIGLAVFLFVGIKRKYNTIDIVDPVTNSSIDFSKTIARLYWLNPNHRKMADQKMKMFLFEVRNRYGLTTHELNEDFKIRFRAKSGIPEKHVNRLFDAYNVARQSNTIHQDLLIQISETIVIIRQNWK